MFKYKYILCVFLINCVLHPVFSLWSRPSEDPLEERWSWGLINETEILTSLRYSTDPCEHPDKKPPDFSAPHRRISQVKCYEYIWDIKNRQDKADDIDKCFLQKMAREGWVPLIGGEDAALGEYPHMGAIGWKASYNDSWVFKCGGSLISFKFVLTAAHCTKASSRDTSIADPMPKIVRLGLTDIKPLVHPKVIPVDGKIKRSIAHPMYRSPKKYYDIALLELEEDVEFTMYIHPACLWNKDELEVNNKAIITDWGVVETVHQTTAPTLQKAAVDLIDSSVCHRMLRRYCNRNFCGIRQHQLCGGQLTGGVDTCQGDSEGPIQTRIPLPTSTWPGTINAHMYHIIGVTSFGVGCGRPNTPGVYIRVSSFVDWIEDKVWPSKPEKMQ